MINATQGNSRNALITHATNKQMQHSNKKFNLKALANVYRLPRSNKEQNREEQSKNLERKEQGLAKTEQEHFAEGTCVHRTPFLALQ